MVLGFGGLTVGCVEELSTENYYTFTGQTIADYLKTRPEQFSDFCAILTRASDSNTNFMGLLSSYGEYTCFAPTNAAVEELLKSRGMSSVSDLSFLECDSIARSHLIKVAYKTENLVEGAVPTYNMSYRYLSISYQTDSAGNQEIMVNKASRLISWDNECENGVLHVINHVLEPSNELLPEVMGNNPGITIFTKALTVTGLADSLITYKDENYVPADPVQYDRFSATCESPALRLIGHTVFVEPDSVYLKAGINTIEDLMAYAKSIYDVVYPEDAGKYDTDYTNRKNPLNRFVAYHILHCTLPYNKMNNSMNLNTKYEATDYYETYCPNTILQITQTAAKGKRINRRMKTGKFYYQGTLIQSPSESETTYEQNALNGTYHYIDEILTYNKEVRDVVLGVRMRMDASSFMDELISNNVRNNDEQKLYLLPKNYCRSMIYSEESQIIYEYPRLDFWCWQGDEFYALGNYDFTLRLPPVPAGTYEIRIGYVAMGQRGIAQMYFGDENQFKAKALDPCGIPLDMNRGGTVNPHIGWIADTNSGKSETDIRNDKAMHNRGYMKAPDCLFSYSTNARTASTWLRRIITTRQIDDGPHYLRIRSVVDNTQAEFMLDWIEFCPKSIYDGEEREDIH